MSRPNDQDDAWYPTRRTELRTEDKMAKDKKNKSTQMKVKKPYAEYFKDEAGGIRYRVVDADGKILFTSESYTKISDAADDLFTLTRVMGKFLKWFAKNDDSWLIDLTDGDESAQSFEPESTTYGADSALA